MITIHLHPEITISEVRNLALRHGLTLMEDERGRLVLARNTSPLMLGGARYRSGADLRKTFARERLMQERFKEAFKDERAEVIAEHAKLSPKLIMIKDRKKP